ncbi:MAG: hypothetical protein KGJ13_09745, partial [Patescibacteria group bacterium]|nr:hypothetical protein [Patescibacteria group bacterium]
MAKRKTTIAVLDTETDPFQHQRIPKPFAMEFYSLDERLQIWGDDCAERMASYLQALDRPYMIFAHNGGKFDFHFFSPWLDNPLKIIKSRIVSARLFQHTLRDSYAILPRPLRDFEKMDFDYAKMERSVREKHKAEILTYLHSDCINLYEIVQDFINRFGVQLTIGGTAMKEIRKRHKFRELSETDDATYRRFYFGGRVEAFADGIQKGPFVCVDINSSYPASMRNYDHPVNGSFRMQTTLPTDKDAVYFCRFIGENSGALPAVVDGKLTFNKKEGEFFACSHELNFALERGLARVDEILECYVAQETIQLDTYVNDCMALKLHAENVGDKAGRLFYKLLANSGYGKFGQNPANFEDWRISRDPGEMTDLEEEGYVWVAELDDFDLYCRKSDNYGRGFYDVSIAASITSASRKMLLEALLDCVDPIYCDTDSIICREFRGRIHPTELGAWKVEKTAQFAAIAAKKVYALYDNERGKPVKLASKGGTLTLADILAI